MLRQMTAVGMIAAGAGLAAVSAHAGVEEVIWVEVDNSVGTIDQTVGVPTGLGGVRTFDLYAVVTPDTKVWAADFGYVGDYQGYDGNMWTTQSVYQNEFGGDVQASMVGSMEMFAALEFDSYVGMGMLDSKIVMNTVILGGNWSPSGFEMAWYGSEYSDGVWEAAVADEDGRMFLARVSVASDGDYGDATGDDEWLGGWVFISGEDDDGRFGQMDPKAGLFYAENAFPEPVAVIAGTNGGGGASSAPEEPEPVYGDVNLDGVVDMVDVMLVQLALGSSGSSRDVNGDGVVDAVDIAELMEILGSSETFAGSGGGGVDDGADEGDDLADLSPKERKKIEKARRKAEQQRLKAERKAAKAEAKERKRQEKERKKAAKKREQERKKAEKERKKREKQQQG